MAGFVNDIEEIRAAAYRIGQGQKIQDSEEIEQHPFFPVDLRGLYYHW
jgi:hypothetical protein